MKIEIVGLSKSLAGIDVLSNINLTFESGKIYGLAGGNGCGKTMLLRAISGLLIPTEGKILVDGKRLIRDISFPPKMGLMIENPTFINYLTGYENLKLLASPKRLCTETDIRSWMNEFSISEKADIPVRKYSLGMKQKLGIIQAVMEDPDLLILDEPFNALDENSVDYVRDLLKKYRDEGKLVILTSHHKEDIEMLCDEVYKMSDGEIIIPAE